jgi:NAD(P)-dependent dehydrogenase (short-subunit alcohol dehydrogenase family)
MALSGSPLAARTFGLADQNWFAASCGDVNPMHVDPIRARRTQAGAPVVHGVHALLWALDELAAARRLPGEATAVRATFSKFMYLDRTLELGVSEPRHALARADLRMDGVLVASIDVLSRAARNAPSIGEVLPEVALGTEPRDLDFEEITDFRGRFARPAESFASRFPAASRRLGAPRLAALGQLSALVGMVCPGLHSIFGDLEIDFVDDDGGGVAFGVRCADDRFRSVEIAVAGGGIAGSVTAFVRRPPVDPPAAAELAERIAPDEFAGRTALVVGGSRGLGALTARMLAAGGARVIVTYVNGHDDAREVAAAAPGAMETARYDVLEGVPPEIAARRADIDEVYYFATPTISNQSAQVFSASRLERLLRYYAGGFAELCGVLMAGRARPLYAFYPSSVFVDERPRGMTEYAMAKAAGEVLCADLQRERGVRILMRRLPRLLTDQTASIVPTESADGVAELLPILREIRAFDRVHA